MFTPALRLHPKILIMNNINMGLIRPFFPKSFNLLLLKIMKCSSLISNFDFKSFTHFLFFHWGSRASSYAPSPWLQDAWLKNKDTEVVQVFLSKNWPWLVVLSWPVCSFLGPFCVDKLQAKSKNWHACLTILNTW